MILPPVIAKRPKTGGRRKGTPNKSTIIIREAMLTVFAELQAADGGGAAHLLAWAKGNTTEFYRLANRMLPPPAPEAPVLPPITRIELVSPGLEEIERIRAR